MQRINPQPAPTPMTQVIRHLMAANDAEERRDWKTAIDETIEASNILFAARKTTDTSQLEDWELAID